MIAPETLISISHVSKRFGGVVAVNDLSFDIRAGELHSIVGENGAGKSTLMKILSGVLTEYEGQIRLRGREVLFSGTRDAEEAGVSIIHQELNLVEELTVAANIFLGREKRTGLGFIDDRAMEKESAQLFEQLQCQIAPTQLISELRIGDQQLVEIAKALSLHANILIMDEPTSALTESEVERLFKVIERLQSSGVTIVYISHKMDEVFHLSDRITVLRDGKLVKSLERDATTPREVTHLMVGRDIEEVERRTGGTTGDIVLEVKNLFLPWTGHAREWRLQDINFSLKRGEVLGIAGLMGAGRTELLECLFGASPTQPQGQIWLDGALQFFDTPATAMQQGVALVTEDRKRLGLFDHMSVRDNITICSLEQITNLGLVSKSREQAITAESIDALGVKCDGTEVGISSLSGGNQQKCVIARWLRTHPELLLLDDPTRGVDVGAKSEIYKLINGLCQDGMAIILTSSELPELIKLSDRVLVLCEGLLTGRLEGDAITEKAIMEAATQRNS